MPFEHTISINFVLARACYIAKATWSFIGQEDEEERFEHITQDSDEEKRGIESDKGKGNSAMNLICQRRSNTWKRERGD